MNLLSAMGLTGECRSIEDTVIQMEKRLKLAQEKVQERKAYLNKLQHKGVSECEGPAASSPA